MSAIMTMTELMRELERVRDLLRQREEEIGKRMSAWNKLRDGYDESIAQLQDQLATTTAERDEAVRVARGLAECGVVNQGDIDWATIALNLRRKEEPR